MLNSHQNSDGATAADADFPEGRNSEFQDHFPDAPEFVPERHAFTLTLPILPPPFSSPISVRFGVKKYRRWRNILRGECQRCFYCGRTISLKTSALDHIVSRSRGGGNHPSNLRLACHWCNNLKGNLTLEEYAGKLERMARRIRDLAEAVSVEAELTINGNSVLFFTTPDEGVSQDHQLIYGPRLPVVVAERCKSTNGELERPIRSISTKSQLMANSPFCANCGRMLQNKNHGSVDDYARLVRGPQKLACRKCQGAIAAQFHAERVAASAAVQSHRSEATEVVITADP